MRSQGGGGFVCFVCVSIFFKVSAFLAKISMKKKYSKDLGKKKPFLNIDPIEEIPTGLYLDVKNGIPFPFTPH